MDPALTTALIESTLDILAEEGLARVNADVVTTRIRAGKAALYRRWASIPEMITDAVRTCELIPEVADRVALRSDLLSLLTPWTRSLDRDERAMAALLGHVGPRTPCAHVVRAVLLEPLAARVADIASPYTGRGYEVTGTRLRLLKTAVEALWLQRYTIDPRPRSPAEVADLVDYVLLSTANS